jgi:hypothetical protein
MEASETDHEEPPASVAQTASTVSLWTLQKRGRFIACAVRCGTERWVEVQIRRDGQLCVLQEFDELALAVAHADSLRHDLGLHGWQSA